MCNVTLKLHELQFQQIPSIATTNKLVFSITFITHAKNKSTPWFTPNNMKIKFNSFSYQFTDTNIEILLLCKAEETTYKWGHRIVNLSTTTDSIECFAITNKKNVNIATLICSIVTDSASDTDEGIHQAIPPIIQTGMLKKPTVQPEPYMPYSARATTINPSGDVLKRKLLNFLNKRMEYQKEKESLFKELQMYNCNNLSSDILSMIDTPKSVSTQRLSIDTTMTMCPIKGITSVKNTPTTSPLKVCATKYFITPFSNRAVQNISMRTAMNTERSNKLLQRKCSDDKENSHNGACKNLSRQFQTIEKSRSEFLEGQGDFAKKRNMDKRLMNFFADMTNVNM